MQTIKSIKKLVSNISYKDWDVIVKKFKDDDRPYIQIQFYAPCNNTGEPERQYCRKWALSYYMTNTEVIRTAYKAVRDAEMHEMQENFKYMGERIFSPHINLEAMVEFVKHNSGDKRVDMRMKEVA